MQKEFIPTLKKVNVAVDPATMSQYVYHSQNRYLLIDIQAPEVSTVQLNAVARANRTTYEQAVNKYFAGDFQFDEREINEAEPRTIYYLDQMQGAIDPDGKYTMTLIILDFRR